MSKYSEAIKWLELCDKTQQIAVEAMKHCNKGKGDFEYLRIRCDYYKLAIEALRAAEARDSPKPLTVEELRERNGKPVYVIPGHGKPYWALIDIDDDNRANGIDKFGDYQDGDFYNMQESYYEDNVHKDKLHVLGWLAYDYPPKEQP